MLTIPERARIVRKGQKEPCAIAFAKRGNNTLFAIASPDDNKANIVAPEEALRLFAATPEEKSFEYCIAWSFDSFHFFIWLEFRIYKMSRLCKLSFKNGKKI